MVYGQELRVTIYYLPIMARPRIKKVPKLKFEINFNNYLQLIKVAFLYPRVYISQIPEPKGIVRPLLFFITNTSLGFFLGSIWRQINDVNHPSIFFALSQLLILIPLLVISFFIGCSILFVIAKLLGGKASFEITFNLLCYCLLPLILINLPLVSILAFLWIIILITLGFKKIHQYSMLAAIVTVLFPFLLLALLGIILGVLGSLIFVNLPNFSQFNLPFSSSSFSTKPQQIQTN